MQWALDSLKLLRERPGQFVSNLLQPAAVGFALFMKNSCNFWTGPHLSFSILLNLQVQHFFDQLHGVLGVHNFTVKALYKKWSALHPNRRPLPRTHKNASKPPQFGAGAAPKEIAVN